MKIEEFGKENENIIVSPWLIKEELFISKIMELNLK